MTNAPALLRRTPIIDGHNDLMWELREQGWYDPARIDPATRLTTTHTDLERLQEGGVGAQFWSVYVPGNVPEAQAVQMTLEQISGVHDLIERCPERTQLVTDATELDHALTTDRLGSLLGAEGGQSMGSSMPTLRALFRLGVRYLTLTHNHHVPWADSATQEPRLKGLSRFGEEVVREMNRLGMAVDLSHVAADTMRHALKVSTAPVMFSHSSADSLCPSPRNVPDDVLETLRSNGGICMVTFVPDFVSTEAAQWRLSSIAAAQAAGIDPNNWTVFQEFCAATQPPKPRATLAQVADHIEYVRQVAGIDHVGIGGDYDGTSELPEGLHDVSTYPALITELQRRGWNDEDLGKLTWHNARRVLHDVGAHASDLRNQRGPSYARIEDLDAAVHP